VAVPPSEAATGAPDNGTGGSTQPDGGASQAVGAGPGTPEPNGRSVAADHAGADAGRGGGPVPPGSQVPGWLQRAAGWSWRLLLVGIVIYLAFRVASVLRVVVLPCVAALLLTALLQPLTSRLRRLGLPALAATWCTILLVVVVLAGVSTLAATRATADYPALVNQVKHTGTELQSWLAGPPFHIRNANIEDLSNRVLGFLKQHQSMVLGTVVSGGKIFLEILAGLVLMLRPDSRDRTRLAGTAAWQALTYYVRGTIAVAAIHAVVIGFSLWVLGVPLLVPLTILVFIAAFIPLIGILVAGTLAVLVTLATQGWIAAVVLVAIFILENQLEGHLLQPLVVGRMVRLHPLAVILVLAVGGVVAGIPGAIVAVPTTAALVRAVPYLRGSQPGVGSRE
jgi:predicted PurR-regulated permease PerM